ncbi:lecithin retinol acyltransferase family protein [Crenobacter sp. SG2305]|uniref:lecithin retinol acyltransferase family protein n=1 Tax=Crenobacter oryzisoli TaxID=3056844 RepID=UPI0025AB2A9A|nr:lecithin retinol acyltransferase family protein [Crenobacter sp. SG2305]MDN0083169.1 lecithin retinol acyltransferase family protein [Crenobacter sp. SG2305]
MKTDKQQRTSDHSIEPLLGAHLITPRCGYCHHGIYVGEGRVVHYAGFGDGHRCGPVEEIPLARFAAGHEVWVKVEAWPKYNGTDAVRRARSRLGENCYRLWSNNCEHFCTWCLHDENRSEQVETWLTEPLAALHTALRLLLVETAARLSLSRTAYVF